MELLATYTFGQALLTVLEFALLVLWIWLAVTVVVDVFRSHDLSGWAKAGWVVLIVLLPLLGVLIYVIAPRRQDEGTRGESESAYKSGRSSPTSRTSRTRGIITDDEVQRGRTKSQPITSARPSPDDDVAELEVLRDRGILSDEEFQRAKQRALAA